VPFREDPGEDVGGSGVNRQVVGAASQGTKVRPKKYACWIASSHRFRPQ
jgi:hypothetical protein